MRAMQQWLDRFCYKHPRLSIPGLMRYIVIGNVLVFLLDLFSTGGYPIATSLLSFSSDAILQGQIWRIITFVFVPATSRNIFLFAITLYFYYFIGNALEREWGSNKFTIFYFFGILLNILVGFLVGTASMYYVNMSMFFAFATLYPDVEMRFYFVIPIRAKWLALLYVFLMLWDIIQTPTMFLPIVLPMMVPSILASLVNYVLFFWSYLTPYFRRFRHQNSRQTINFKKAARE